MMSYLIGELQLTKTWNPFMALNTYPLLKQVHISMIGIRPTHSLKRLFSQPKKWNPSFVPIGREFLLILKTHLKKKKSIMKYRICSNVKSYHKFSPGIKNNERSELSQNLLSCLLFPTWYWVRQLPLIHGELISRELVCKLDLEISFEILLRQDHS